MVIREGTDADRAALVRIAQRDSKPIPTGALVVAETDGELRAAVEIETGRTIADPFRHTADLVGLLRARADQLGDARRHRLRVIARTPTPAAQPRRLGQAAA